MQTVKVVLLGWDLPMYVSGVSWDFWFSEQDLKMAVLKLKNVAKLEVDEITIIIETSVSTNQYNLE